MCFQQSNENCLGDLCEICGKRVKVMLEECGICVPAAYEFMHLGMVDTGNCKDSLLFLVQLELCSDQSACYSQLYSCVKVLAVCL